MPDRSIWTDLWRRLWPKLGAGAIALVLWELVVLSKWRPPYVLPGPAAVLGVLWDHILAGDVAAAVLITLGRAAMGYAIAVVVGTTLGLGLARMPLLRTAFGSLLAAIQSMPSVAWFPLAILLFQLSEISILFVVVLGAAPSIAMGLISAQDQVPPLLVRAGRMLGARGFTLQRLVVIPAALPGFVAGLRQGWAFSWRSLMAGELLVIIGNRPSLGVRLQYAREFSDAPALLAWLLVVIAIGLLVDGVFFTTVERGIRTRRGLAGR
jgi:NitT/TauT family transport system permease protein